MGGGLITIHIIAFHPKYSSAKKFLQKNYSE